MNQIRRRSPAGTKGHSPIISGHAARRRLSKSINKTQSVPKAAIRKPPSRLFRGTPTKVVSAIAILASFLAAVSNIGNTSLGRLLDKHTPGYLERQLDHVREGVLIQRLEHTLDESPVATLDQDIQFRRGPEVVMARELLYVLDGGYLRAFVSESDMVLAYSLTFKPGVELGEIKAAWTDIKVGEHTIGSFAPGNDVYYACGAHTASYFEVTEGPIAAGARTLALGSTDAGGDFGNGLTNACRARDMTSMLVASPPNMNPDRFYLDRFAMTDRFLLAAKPFRESLKINSLAVVSPGYEMPPAVVAVHPQIIGPHFAD